MGRPYPQIRFRLEYSMDHPEISQLNMVMGFMKIWPKELELDLIMTSLAPSVDSAVYNGSRMSNEHALYIARGIAEFWLLERGWNIRHYRKSEFADAEMYEYTSPDGEVCDSLVCALACAAG